MSRFSSSISITAAALACLLFSCTATAAAPDRVIIFTNSSRNLDAFRAFAKSASRMKRYGRVQIDIGVLAAKAAFEVPPGGEEWHQYAAFNANLSKFFPHPKIAPFYPADWVAKNRALLLAKAAILREYGLEAAMSSNDTHYLPEAFFEKYPQLRGPRVDHPRRSRREEFSFCVDLPETREMIEWMAAEAKRNIPELKTILVHTNDSGTGLCWAEGQYSGPNGAEHCRTRGTGRRVHDLLEALHRGAVHGGGDIDVRIGGQFTTPELDDIARQLPPHSYLSGRDPLEVGGHGSSERDPTAIGVATMVLQTYPVLGLIDPLAVLADMEKFQQPQTRTLVLGVSLPWYYRADEPLDTTNRLIDLAQDAIASPSEGLMPRFRKLHELTVKWGGEENADRLFEAFYLLDQAFTASAQAGRYTTLYAGVSTRLINRPLVLLPEALTHAEESYFLPFVFNQSETQARLDPIDNHGSRLRGPLPTDPAYQQFASSALRAAAIFEEIHNAPQQAWLSQLALSLRIWVSAMESVGNVIAAQRIRDSRAKALAAPPPATFKGAWPAGEPDYLAWYQIQRRELDNTAELIRLLNAGGLAWFAHARRPEDEDTFLFGPNVIDTLAQKRHIMRAHWLDAQQYIASPHR
jgi:hypothetical protein